jgi:WD40 repeat protein
VRALVTVVLIACGNRSEPRPAESGSGAPTIAALPKGTPIDLAPKAKRVFGDGPRHADPVEMVAFSADGSRLASVDRDGQVFVWDVASGKPIEASHTEAYRQFVGFAGAEVVTKPPADLRMVTASSDGRWIFGELEDGIGPTRLGSRSWPH